MVGWYHQLNGHMFEQPLDAAFLKLSTCQFLNVREYRLFLVAEVTGHFVVVVIVKFIDEFAADFVQLLYQHVYVAVELGKADTCIEPVRCAQIGGYALDIILCECLNLWGIVTE